MSDACKQVRLLHPLSRLPVQVFEVATDAGADDIVPANDEDDHLEGYKVTLALSLYFVQLYN